MKKIMRTITGLLTAAAMTAAMLCSGVTASATSSNVKPHLSVKKTYADQIVLTVDNAKSYPDGTVFGVYRCGRKVTSISKNFAASIPVSDSGVTYLKPDTAYTYSVMPILTGSTAASGLTSTLKVRTSSVTSYQVKAGTQLYTLSNGKLTAKKKLAAKKTVHGVPVFADGTEAAGKSLSLGKAAYVKFTDGKLVGYYARATQVTRTDEPAAPVKSHEEQVIETRKLICDYAASMDGGRYVWGGTAYRACDCSGLVMLAYAQAGINITHSSYGQEQLGIPVSFSNMEPGDIIGMNYGGHVGLYLGDGKLVHALNPNDGIKITPLSYLQYFHVDCVRRLIY